MIDDGDIDKVGFPAMNDSSPRCSDKPSGSTDAGQTPERRSAERIGCHTVVTAITPHNGTSDDEVEVLKAYSEDVSVSGARVISKVPLPTARLFLRFLLPDFGDRYVEAEVVTQSQRERHLLPMKPQKEYVYGVRFTGVMTDATTMDCKVAASRASRADHD